MEGRERKIRSGKRKKREKGKNRRERKEEIKFVMNYERKGKNEG